MCEFLLQANCQLKRLRRAYQEGPHLQCVLLTPRNRLQCLHRIREPLYTEVPENVTSG